MSVCWSCGLPPGTDGNKGRSVQIVIPAENGFQRNRKSTVWVCSNECAVQALAISKYGPASHRWPISLAQFRSTLDLDD